MVKQGMKVGDTFFDNGKGYVVLSVNQDKSYVSKMTDKEEAKPSEKPKKRTYVKKG